MTMQVALQWAVTIFGGGGIAWLVGLWRDKRKADAEAGQHDASAADLIEQASGRLVDRFEKRFREDQDTIGKLQRDNEALIRNARQHEEWDRMAVAKLAEVGVQLPAPPTLHIEEGH
ncbi:membrane protein [Gordonia phage LonelyBoi]|nr:membrane protein [Gordonia phage LonelyBoi]